MPDRIEFLAVLVFDRGDGWWITEPHTFRASHPEIAYQLAFAKGREPRGNKEFLGLAGLRVKQGDGPVYGEMQEGNAEELVRGKASLSAFQESRWQGLQHDPVELEEALSEPAVMVELDGLDDIDWGGLSHAYGPAKDVPTVLRRLTAFDPEVRAHALFILAMTIFHQETLYPATAPAIPFLLKLASIPSFPDRLEVLGFVEGIVRECRFESGAGFDPDSAIFTVLWTRRTQLRELQSDEDPLIRVTAAFILEQLEGEDRESG